MDLRVTLQEYLNPQILLQIMMVCLEERVLKDYRIHRVEWGPYGNAFFLQVGVGRVLCTG